MKVTGAARLVLTSAWFYASADNGSFKVNHIINTLEQVVCTPEPEHVTYTISQLVNQQTGSNNFDNHLLFSVIFHEKMSKLSGSSLSKVNI